MIIFLFSNIKHLRLGVTRTPIIFSSGYVPGYQPDLFRIPRSQSDSTSSVGDNFQSRLIHVAVDSSSTSSIFLLPIVTFLSFFLKK